MSNLKFCFTCKTWKKKEDFPVTPNEAYKDGIKSRCYQCQRDYQRDYQKDKRQQTISKEEAVSMLVDYIYEKGGDPKVMSAYQDLVSLPDNEEVKLLRMQRLKTRVREQLKRA